MTGAARGAAALAPAQTTETHVHTVARVAAATQFVRRRFARNPRVGLVLGTGLGGLAGAIHVESTVDYADIPHFPLSTVESHTGRLLCGTLAGQTIVAMQGRFHRYEGYSLQQVTFPIRVLRALGADILIVSNACGGMRADWGVGDLMVISDHINLLGDNPLIGVNDNTFGPRFPDMSAPYDAELRRLAHQVAGELGFPLREGVYVAVPGPNLETRAEYRFLRGIGADVVGMSTVPEVIVAVHGGLRVLGVSVVTDECLPDTLQLRRSSGSSPWRRRRSLALRHWSPESSAGCRDQRRAIRDHGGIAWRRSQYQLLPPELRSLEADVLAKWEIEHLFARTLQAAAGRPKYIFYEGPPTANGKPGIHHVFARTIKDLFCRHRAMRGFLVPRKAGWDTHGLAVEIEVEKKLEITAKAQIESLGVAHFNAECRASVWAYRSDWERLSQRIGYWLDYTDPYVTYAPEYVESVWWALATLWQRGLLYHGHKILPYCPRCETALSSHEVAQGYSDVQDPSIYIALPMSDPGRRILVWTTTPWTLVSNVGLAVHPEPRVRRAASSHGRRSADAHHGRGPRAGGPGRRRGQRLGRRGSPPRV